MLQVSRRGGFSDRNGIKVENTEIQLRDFDERTRAQLINMVSQFYADIYKGEYTFSEAVQSFIRYVLGDVYAHPLNACDSYDVKKFFKIINETIMGDEYDAVLTLIEAIVQYLDIAFKKKSKGYRDGQGITIYERANAVFKQEYVGYRFLGECISPISDEEEVEAISDALANPYESVREHILKANVLLSDRTNPDYENSIKESISAVEAICEIMTGIQGKEATLGKMLKKLEDNGIVIHSALKTAFNILYGYTSDANGIRHAGDIGGPASTFEEAKFMLVACSAFINYLIGVSADKR